MGEVCDSILLVLLPSSSSSWSWSLFKCQPLLFSCPIVSNYLQPHGLQHARLPCPSLSPGICFNSCPLSWWCHPTISSSVTPFSSCLWSFPASRYFPVNKLFTSGGQSIGASTSASVLPMSIQGWFPLRLTGLISLQSKGLSRVFFSTTVWKASILPYSALFMVQLSQLYVTTGKTIALTILTSVHKVMSLLFNSLSRVVSPLEYSNWSSWLMKQPLGWYLVDPRDVPRRQELSSWPLFGQQENTGRPWSRKRYLVSFLRSYDPGST